MADRRGRSDHSQPAIERGSRRAILPSAQLGALLVTLDVAGHLVSNSVEPMTLEPFEEAVVLRDDGGRIVIRSTKIA